MAKSSLIVAMFGLLVVAGCATSPMPTELAAPVPANRVMAPEVLSAKPGTGQVVIKRDAGLSGSGCTIRVFVDANPIADLAGGEKITAFLPVGERIVSISAVSTLCPSTVVEASVLVTAERPKALRIGMAESLDLLLQPTAF